MRREKGYRATRNEPNFDNDRCLRPGPRSVIVIHIMQMQYRLLPSTGPKSAKELRDDPIVEEA